MAKKKQTPEEELARLEEDLEELKKTLPEHCYGSKGYIGISPRDARPLAEDRGH